MVALAEVACGRSVGRIRGQGHEKGACGMKDTAIISLVSGYWDRKSVKECL